MILAIDVGNSNIVLGGYEAEKLAFISRIATDRHCEADQYATLLHGILQLYDVDGGNIEGVVISSVVPGVTHLLAKAVAHFSVAPIHILTLADAGNIRIAIDTPRELGMDILASAIAVEAAYPLPAIIIDMGTATKLTALDAEGRLLGVSIAPGLFLSLEALVGNASLLQGIEVSVPPSAIGRNTQQSMQSGMVLGNAAMLDGLIDRFEAEMGACKTLIATGGAAPVVVPHCKHNVLYSDTLLLDGLLLAYRNSEKA